jgi:hypothetical protein
MFFYSIIRVVPKIQQHKGTALIFQQLNVLLLKFKQYKGTAPKIYIVLWGSLS